MIVERYIKGIDIAMPVIGARHPWLLPPIKCGSASGTVRTYEERRDLVVGRTEFMVVTDRALLDELHAPSRAIVEKIWPFERGRLIVPVQPTYTAVVLAAPRPGGDPLAEVSAGGHK